MEKTYELSVKVNMIYFTISNNQEMKKIPVPYETKKLNLNEAKDFLISNDIDFDKVMKVFSERINLEMSYEEFKSFIK